MVEADGVGEASRAARRAIRRLSVISGALLLAAALLAVAGGWIAAWLLTRVVDAPFRVAWAVLSVLFLAGPSLVVARAERKRGRRSRRDSESGEQERAHG